MERQHTSYTLWLDDQFGNRLEILEDIISFDVVRVANSIGVCQVVLPGTFDLSLINIDYMIEIWRAPAFGANQLVTVFFIRKIIYEEDTKGNDIIVLEGMDANDLLNRRIIAYSAGTSETSKSDFGDDMLKEIVAENLGASATDSDRDISSLQFAIAGDVSHP